MEKWRDIQGYEGLYQVSNLGRVRSLHYGKIRIINQIKHGNYFHVYLSKNGIQKWFEVHQLVAQTFVTNPNEYNVVHHKDHNPANNCVDNLEWISKDEHNEMHQSDRTEPLIKRVDQIDKVTGEILHQWNSSREAARELGYDHSWIGKCARGICTMAYGYVWKYIK